MCWHILALFYVVSVRYVFYITFSSKSSCVLESSFSIFSCSVGKYVVEEALQFLGGLRHVNKF